MDLDPIVLKKVATESGTSPQQTEATLDLLEHQAAIPFIACYRKELTGNLDESRIRRIEDRYRHYKTLLDRRQSMLDKIESQGKLTEALRTRILACYDKNHLEDLYSPFKPRRNAEATSARELGLEPLARLLWEQTSGEEPLAASVEKYISVDKKLSGREEVIQAALHIVTEWITQDPAIRDSVRRMMLSEGFVVSKVREEKKGQKSRYDSYDDFREQVSRIPFHRIAALRRGAKERVLAFNIEVDDEKVLQMIKGQVIHKDDSEFASFLETAIKNAYFKTLKPFFEVEVRTRLKERSDDECLKLFQTNLTHLLLAPPLGSVPVMGIDPGVRSACKVAVVDGTGKYQEHATIYLTLPRNHTDRAEAILYRLIRRHGVRAIAVGNGPGSRETDRFVKGFLGKYHGGHDFDLSLVRGKKGKASSPAKEETDIRVHPTDPEPAGMDSLHPTEGEKSPSPQPEEGTSSSEALPLAASEPQETGDPKGSQLEGEPAGEEGLNPPLSSSDPNQSQTTALPAATQPSQPAPAAEGETAAGDHLTEASPQDLAEQSSIEANTAEIKQEGEEPERQFIFTVIVHKGGTSAYSNSETARKEFPKLDLGVRGAISIARRLQDPLAELAKVPPRSIGVGQYQQDVEQKRLKQQLGATLTSCINQVGVDLNRASAELLSQVAGLNQPLARSVVAFREQHGRFSSRSQLREVPGFTPQTFEQAAGFLRVKGGDQPLDSTAIHPESYGLVQEMAQSVQVTVDQLLGNPEKLEQLDLQNLARDGVGIFSLKQIQQELRNPGRDPRKAFVPPSFRDDVKDVSDLHKGMLVEGTVSNVTSFGAFVDIGVQQDGLVHISELSSRFIQDPNAAVYVGQVVKAKVIGVDADTKRISLSIKALEAKTNSGRRKRKRPEKATEEPSSPTSRSSSSGRAGNVPERLTTSKSDQKPHNKKHHRRRGKKPQPTHVTTAVLPRRHSAAPEAEDLPDTSNLSFSEKIRLLQEKFGGIR